MMIHSRYASSLYLGLTLWTALGSGATPPPPSLIPPDGEIIVRRTEIATGSRWERPLPSVVPFSAALVSFTPDVGSPPAVAEFYGGDTCFRAQCRLYGATYYRLAVNVKTGQADVTMTAQFSLDDGSSWAYLDGLSGPLISLAMAGTIVGDWAAVDDDARTDVLLRLVTNGGDGVTPIDLGLIYLEFGYVHRYSES